MVSSTGLWFFFSIEFLIIVAISSFLVILNVIKSLLPKPPRDLTGNVVLIAGASSTLGKFVVEEFIKSGCSVICIDNNIRSVNELIARLKSRYHKLEKEAEHRNNKSKNVGSIIAVYECNLLNSDAIREVAKKIKDKVSSIDILVTCPDRSIQDIYDIVTMTLMSHYWMMLVFLPFMLQCEKPYIIGITSVTSTTDTYLNSKTAVASLMESLGQELSNRNIHLTFLTVSPIIEQSSMMQKEKQIAKQIVQAVSRDQCSININWSSKILYHVSCVIYNTIIRFTEWLHTQRCDFL